MALEARSLKLSEHETSVLWGFPVQKELFMLYLVWFAGLLGACFVCLAIAYLFDLWDWF